MSAELGALEEAVEVPRLRRLVRRKCGWRVGRPAARDEVRGEPTQRAEELR